MSDVWSGVVSSGPGKERKRAKRGFQGKKLQL